MRVLLAVGARTIKLASGWRLGRVQRSGPPQQIVGHAPNRLLRRGLVQGAIGIERGPGGLNAELFSDRGQLQLDRDQPKLLDGPVASRRGPP